MWFSQTPPKRRTAPQARFFDSSPVSLTVAQKTQVVSVSSLLSVDEVDAIKKWGDQELNNFNHGRSHL